MTAIFAKKGVISEIIKLAVCRKDAKGFILRWLNKSMD